MLYSLGGFLSIASGFGVYFLLSLEFSPAGVWNGADLLGLAFVLAGLVYGGHLFAKGEEVADAEFVKRLKEMEHDD